MSKRDMTQNRALCILPYIHLMIKPSGAVKPCCRFDITDDNPNADEMRGLNIERMTPGEILESEQYKKLRADMLDGKFITGCYKCYEEEDATGDSMRLMLNRTFGATPNQFDEIVNLRYIEVTFGNYCNLACRTCQSHLSTTWYDDDVALSKIPALGREAEEQRLNVEFTWTASDFDNVERIKFTGGEPMLHPNFVKFIDTIMENDNQSHIELDIYTNASWTPKTRLLNKLTQFKRVTINFSIDGTGKTNDYIRHKSNWSDVVKSTRRWLQLDAQNDNIETVLCMTFNILNINNLESTIEWWTRERHRAGASIFGTPEKRSTTLIMLQTPTYMHIKNHPDLRQRVEDLKQYLEGRDYRDTGERFITERFLGRAMELMYKYADEQHDPSLFWTYTNALDKLRSESLEQALPELYEQFKQKQ